MHRQNLGEVSKQQVHERIKIAVRPKDCTAIFRVACKTIEGKEPAPVCFCHCRQPGTKGDNILPAIRSQFAPETADRNKSINQAKTELCYQLGYFYRLSRLTVSYK